MNQPTPPPMPDLPPPPPSPPPAPKKSRTNAIIIGSAAAVIAAIVATGIVVVQATNEDSKPAATTAASSTPSENAEPAVEVPDPEPTYAEPAADDFAIDLRTIERQCFGSAGCNITVEPKLAYLGLTDLDPDAVYEITYEIRGGDSGPVIETAQLSDETSLTYSQTLVSTPSSKTKLTVQITDVVSRGY